METTPPEDPPPSAVPPAPAAATTPAPWAYDPGPAPRRRAGWRVAGMVAGAVAVFTLGVVVGAAVDILDPFGADAPPVVTYGRDGDLRDTAALREGTCLTGSFGSEPPLHRVGRPVSCERPHRFEAFGEAVAPEPAGGGYDAAGLAWFGDGACYFLFSPYVGLPFAESSLDMVAVIPTEPEWEDGARSVRCLLFDFGQGSLDHSGKDSRI